VLLDSGLKVPLDSRLVATAAETPLWVFCSEAVVASDPRLADRMTELRVRSVVVHPVAATPGRGVSLPLVLAELARARVTHVSVEPGPRLARSFFDNGLVDRLWVFRSPNRIDDETAPAAAPVPAPFLRTAELDLDGDRLTEYLNPSSGAFFAAEPSADLVLARP
jgi:diaminohydroxyphosphoribosylaminopyrimidine deaminase/5-amino-6-(5-phosphoribosylamino)uracil reductase